MKLKGWEMLGDGCWMLVVGCWLLVVDDVWIYNVLYGNH